MKKYLAIFICLFVFCYANQNQADKKLKILIGSPINQKPKILKEFLDSLKRLEKESFTLDYFFVDHNNVEESQKLLNDFKNEIKASCLIHQVKDDTQFIRDRLKHHWNEVLIEKVTQFKDTMISKALNENYDYLFLIDSDLVLHPKTLKQLLKTDKDVISNIFWTLSRNGVTYLPQVWASPDRSYYKHEVGEALTYPEINDRMNEFLNMLKIPGIYEVAGLGACTLISKTALKKGVCFKKIDNLNYYGEDLYFCKRAYDAKLLLFVDTHYPTFHIYRESELGQVQNFIRRCEKTNYDTSLLKSRFILKSDKQMNSVATIPLPLTWWSRPYEYKWASEFVGFDYVALDAGCGLVYPFKWFLSDSCLKAWACDINPQILDVDKILKETKELFGKENEKMTFNLDKMRKTHLICSSICNLPVYLPKYDRIFCISTLTDMSISDIEKTLSEFSKKLQPDGLIILTFDYPSVDPKVIFEKAESKGLIPAGDIELTIPSNAISYTKNSSQLYVYRCVLQPKRY